jgi:hypothetical protein
LLSKSPEQNLAHEWARPAVAILDQISCLAGVFERRAAESGNDNAKRQAHEEVAWQLDFALSQVYRSLSAIVHWRARRTKCVDLLCPVTRSAIGDSSEAEILIRRYQELFPEDSRDSDGSVGPDSFPDQLAWEAWERMEVLDRVADEFPDHVATAARQMPGWPMLVRRHNANQARFRELADRFQLGKDYPLDASKKARFRADTPMVRYLENLVCRVNVIRELSQRFEYASVEEEKEDLRSRWYWKEKTVGEEVLEVALALRKLPPLTKATSSEWAEKALVPNILVTDARDHANCEEPALRAIARQKDVKSAAMFRSRLLAAVSATLKRLARPAE